MKQLGNVYDSNVTKGMGKPKELPLADHYLSGGNAISMGLAGIYPRGVDPSFRHESRQGGTDTRNGYPLNGRQGFTATGDRVTGPVNRSPHKTKPRYYPMKALLFFVALLLLGSSSAGELTNNGQEQEAGATGYDGSPYEVDYYFHTAQVIAWQDRVIAENNRKIEILLAEQNHSDKR